MTDPLIETGGRAVALLRKLEVWVLLALAAIFGVLMYVPTPLLAYRDWLFVGVIVCVVFAVARSVDRYIQYLRDKSSKRALRLVARDRPSTWYAAKQRDDTFISQITLEVDATNLTDQDVRMVRVRLVRPRRHGELLHGDVSLPKAGSPYHSHEHPVPARDTITGSLHIMVHGKIGRAGRPVSATIEITDQYGDRYRLKRLLLSPMNPKDPWQPIARLGQWARKLPGLRPSTKTQAAGDRAVRAKWQHSGVLDDVEGTLKEERRSYAANGRERGGLGSLNVTLQSEPNFGWTKVGDVPVLLWQKSKAVQIASANLARLIAMHAARDANGKVQVEAYLLSHLHKGSTYASVGYFIFLALHRLGKTMEALNAATAHLAGDRDNAFSNLLGVLSALISHEYFAIPLALYDQIEAALPEDAKGEFRLAEKLNLGRLRLLDEHRANANEGGSNGLAGETTP
jgi:hypothetical protein